jgi:hypothetical protein
MIGLELRLYKKMWDKIYKKIESQILLNNIYLSIENYLSKLD